MNENPYTPPTTEPEVLPLETPIPIPLQLLIGGLIALGPGRLVQSNIELVTLIEKQYAGFALGQEWSSYKSTLWFFSIVFIAIRRRVKIT